MLCATSLKAAPSAVLSSQSEKPSRTQQKAVEALRFLEQAYGGDEFKKG
jgi:hypothetical protein